MTNRVKLSVVAKYYRMHPHDHINKIRLLKKQIAAETDLKVKNLLRDEVRNERRLKAKAFKRIAREKEALLILSH